MLSVAQSSLPPRFWFPPRATSRDPSLIVQVCPPSPCRHVDVLYWQVWEAPCHTRGHLLFLLHENPKLPSETVRATGEEESRSGKRRRGEERGGEERRGEARRGEARRGEERSGKRKRGEERVTIGTHASPAVRDLKERPIENSCCLHRGYDICWRDGEVLRGEAMAREGEEERGREGRGGEERREGKRRIGGGRRREGDV
eukprot:767531-Hanusia_phi.AAC.2